MKLHNDFIENIFNEWQINGFCKDALELNNSLSKEIFDTGNPHFFTGDLKSKIVMVQLNPKRNQSEFYKKNTKSFEEYINFYCNYSKVVYRSESSKKFKSRFDQKLIRFLRPLNIIDLNSSDIFKNLENVVDEKLQIELIPFGSSEFDFTKLSGKILLKYTEHLLTWIFAEERTHVLFGGRVFSYILKPYIIKENIHSFKLQKTNGELTKKFYEISEIKLQYNKNELNAYIVPQFSQQGMPVEAYGKKLSTIMNH